jgi:hypothetical protein
MPRKGSLLRCAANLLKELGDFPVQIPSARILLHLANREKMFSGKKSEKSFNINYNQAVREWRNWQTRWT